MISSESPFRRLPIDLPRRQILYLDALRLSAEMAAIAFQRLNALLMHLSEKGAEPLGDGAVRALVDAYSVVDSAHRFREVLRVTPGLKHNAGFELFMRRTQAIEKIRDVVQHLNREVDAIAQSGRAALGTVTWLGPPKVPGSPPTAWALQAGTLYANQMTFGPMIDLESTLTSGEFLDVSLSTLGVTLNLSKLVAHAQAMVQSLEPSLQEYAAEKERFGSDQLFSVSLVPVNKDSNLSGEAKGGTDNVQ